MEIIAIDMDITASRTENGRQNFDGR
jgi:hypothetical protein